MELDLEKGRQRQLLPSSLGALDATSKVPLPLWQTEARQHKHNKDVESDVCLGCSCCPSAGAEGRAELAPKGAFFGLIGAFWAKPLFAEPRLHFQDL